MLPVQRWGHARKAVAVRRVAEPVLTAAAVGKDEPLPAGGSVRAAAA